MKPAQPMKSKYSVMQYRSKQFDCIAVAWRGRPIYLFPCRAHALYALKLCREDETIRARLRAVDPAVPAIPPRVGQLALPRLMEGFWHQWKFRQTSKLTHSIKQVLMVVNFDNEQEHLHEYWRASKWNSQTQES